MYFKSLVRNIIYAFLFSQVHYLRFSLSIHFYFYVYFSPVSRFSQTVVRFSCDYVNSSSLIKENYFYVFISSASDF